MVSRTAETQKINDVKYYASGEYVVTMSQNDTFTASDFVDSANLNKAVLMSHADGSELTNTVLNNVVTCTEAGATDVECTLWVFGVRA
jgi:hypothetical protein